MDLDDLGVIPTVRLGGGSIRMASLAGAKPRVAGIGWSVEESDVLAERSLRRATGNAIDTGRGHADDKWAGFPGVMVYHRVPAGIVQISGNTCVQESDHGSVLSGVSPGDRGASRCHDAGERRL